MAHALQSVVRMSKGLIYCLSLLNYFTAFVILLSTVSAFSHGICGDLFKVEPRFSPAIVSVLNDARKHYYIRVLSRTIGERRQNIIIAGELHMKSVRASEAGVRLLQAFENRALEVPENWKRDARLDLEKVTKVADKFSDLIELRGTSMDDAIVLEENKIGRNFRVDTALTENWWSRVAFFRITTEIRILFGAMSYFLISSFLPETFTQDVQEIGSLPVMIFGAHYAYAFFDMAMGTTLQRFGQKKWYRYAFNLTYGILVKRNEVMVENLVKILGANPDIENILMVVGAAHNPGMEAMLKQHGFAP